MAAGAVFMGANTYIGNTPNFMAKSIVERRGAPMSSFFGYMGQVGANSAAAIWAHYDSIFCVTFGSGGHGVVAISRLPLNCVIAPHGARLHGIPIKFLS